jgi:hypothetical protein
VGDPPADSGPIAGITMDQDAYQKKVCKNMEWDLESGKPLKESLVRLGLEDVARSLWG